VQPGTPTDGGRPLIGQTDSEVESLTGNSHGMTHQHHRRAECAVRLVDGEVRERGYANALTTEHGPAWLKADDTNRIGLPLQFQQHAHARARRVVQISKLQFCVNYRRA